MRLPGGIGQRLPHILTSPYSSGFGYIAASFAQRRFCKIPEGSRRCVGATEVKRSAPHQETAFRFGSRRARESPGPNRVPRGLQSGPDPRRPKQARWPRDGPWRRPSPRRLPLDPARPQRLPGRHLWRWPARPPPQGPPRWQWRLPPPPQGQAARGGKAAMNETATRNSNQRFPLLRGDTHARARNLRWIF